MQGKDRAERQADLIVRLLKVCDEIPQLYAEATALGLPTRPEIIDAEWELTRWLGQLIRIQP
jgi:hypothetical protein